MEGDNNDDDDEEHDVKTKKQDLDENEDDEPTYSFSLSRGQLEQLSETISYLWPMASSSSNAAAAAAATTTTSSSTSSSSPSIDVLEQPPATAMEFFSNYVIKSRPCIIRNAILEPETTRMQPSSSTTKEVYPSSSTTTSTTKRRPLILTLDGIIEMMEKEYQEKHMQMQKQKQKEDVSAATQEAEEEERQEQEQEEIVDPSTFLLNVDVTPDGQGDCIRTVIFEEEIEVDDDNDNDIGDDDTTCNENIEKKNGTNQGLEKGTEKKQEQQNQIGHQRGGGRRRKRIIETREELFVRPMEVPMTFYEFRDRLRYQSSVATAKNKDDNRFSSPSLLFVGKDGLDIHGRPILRQRVQTKERRLDDDVDCNEDNDDDGEHTNKALPSSSIVYYSRQNDCLRKELPKCLYNKFVQPIHDSLRHWAEPAFAIASGASSFTGTSTSTSDSSLLDAMNLWIGNECTISSIHKDYYENLFYVANGCKTFLLYPPCDVLYLYEFNQFYKTSSFFHCNRLVNTTVNDNNTKLSKNDHDNDDGTGDDDDIDDDDDENNKNMVTATESKSTMIRQEQSSWKIQLDTTNDTTENSSSRNSTSTSTTTTPWIAPDVAQLLLPSSKTTDPSSSSSSSSSEDSNSLLQKYPLLRYVHPISITLNEGELLYIPSLWYHRVTQTCETVGINYWYDMNFESSTYCYYTMLQELSKKPT